MLVGGKIILQEINMAQLNHRSVKNIRNYDVDEGVLSSIQFVGIPFASMFPCLSIDPVIKQIVLLHTHSVFGLIQLLLVEFAYPLWDNHQVVHYAQEQH